jgi:predicted transcriptional regulator
MDAGGWSETDEAIGRMTVSLKTVAPAIRKQRDEELRERLACWLGRWAGATMRSLNRLVELGYVERRWESLPGSGRQRSFYCLSPSGKEAAK